jgi:hypothetical protein
MSTNPTKTITLASIRRSMLANAVRDWITTGDRHEADMAFEASLIATQTITEEDIVESLTFEKNPTMGVTVLTADNEAIFIDTCGNMLRGQAD